MPKTKGPKGLSQLTPHAQASHERCIRQGEELVEFWKAKGHSVHVTVDPLFQMVDGKPTKAIIGFTVNSDMVNGFPRGYGREPPPPVYRWKRKSVSDAGGLFHDY